MILPTKQIMESQSLLGSGATLLVHLKNPRTISNLWEAVRKEQNIGSYHRFILTLDLLFIMGAIEIKNGFLIKASK